MDEISRALADPSWRLPLDGRNRLAAERRSKVPVEIEPLGDQLKLTVIHDHPEPGGMTGSHIGQSWPRVLASLKTLL